MTPLRNSARSIAGLAILLIFTLFLSISFSGDSSQDKEKSKSTSVTTAIPSQKVGKDPDGTIRPTTPAEENKLNAELKKTLDKYPTHSARQNPDGSISLVIAPHYLGVAIATTDADGKVKVRCTDAAQESPKTVAHKHELPEE